MSVLSTVAIVALETAICWAFLDHRLADVVMVFLLGVVGTAVAFGYVASLTATALSVGAVDFFFTEPYLSFAVDDHRHYLTFVIMGCVAAVISGQTERLRRDAATRVRLAVDRARLAEEAQRAQVEVQNERLRNALLSTVSHDLKTPLAVIKGAATSLLDSEDHRADPVHVREQLAIISEEATRLDRLVGNLVDMTSLEAGSLRVRKELQPLEEVIGVALNRLDAQLGKRRVVVTLGEGATVACIDAIWLGQVFVNLLENAVKYTPSDARIDVISRATPGGVEVEVADDGPGVPHGQEEKIFDKFYRATPTGVGMGLGLTICRGILTAHEGRIAYRKGARGGASFHFFLPSGRGSLHGDAPGTPRLPS